MKTTIGAISNVVAGGTPSTKVREYWQNGTIPWMRSGEVNLRRIYDVEGRITELGLGNSNATLIPQDSILVALAGQGKTRGTVAINKISLTTNQSVAAIIPDKEIVDIEYLFFDLDRRYNELRRLSTGDGGRGGLNISLIQSISLLLPPLPEQRKIAEILGTWDEAIRLTADLIAAKQQRKKGLMQRLLTGEVRFPGFGPEHSPKKSSLEVPQGWDLVRMDSVAEINARSLGSTIQDGEEFLYIDLSAVDKGKIEFPSVTIPAKNLPSRARRILQFGDVIMATVRPNLQAYAVCDFDPSGYLCSTGFAVISPYNPADTQFIYQSLYGLSIQSQLQSLLTGSNYPAVNASDVAALKLVWPQNEMERSKISRVLFACDREIDLLQQKHAALQQQKKGLMQRLLTGQVRVKV